MLSIFRLKESSLQHQTLVSFFEFVDIFSLYIEKETKNYNTRYTLQYLKLLNNTAKAMPWGGAKDYDHPMELRGK